MLLQANVCLAECGTDDECMEPVRNKREARMSYVCDCVCVCACVRSVQSVPVTTVVTVRRTCAWLSVAQMMSAWTL